MFKKSYEDRIGISGSNENSKFKFLFISLGNLEISLTQTLLLTSENRCAALYVHSTVKFALQ